MQNRTSVMENTQNQHKVLTKNGARQTVTLSRHVVKERDEQIVAQNLNQPVMAQGHFVEYVSQTGLPCMEGLALNWPIAM